MNITTTPTQDIIVSLRSTILNQNWQRHSFSDKQTNRRQDDNSLSDQILAYTDSLGNMIDELGNAIDPRPTISRMGKGASLLFLFRLLI